MAESKGKGAKGRSYDELSGVGTSRGGPTGTTGNLNSGTHDGSFGMPPYSDAGNQQNADLGEHGDLPALGDRGRGHVNRQSAQGGSQSGAPAKETEREERPEAGKPDQQPDKPSR